MPQVQVKKTITINAPAEKVYDVIGDFTQWRVWSPWLIMEQEVRVNVAESKQSYEWAGNRVGSGNMHILQRDPCRSIDYDLNFLKPYKSNAKVRFELKETKSGTETSWLLDTKLPFFMFFMKKPMTIFLGMDYERGLAMLKDYVETGAVPSQIEIIGNSHYPGCNYVGIGNSSSITDMGATMAADIEKLNHFFDSNCELRSGPVICIYHQWDPAKGQMSYTAAQQVSQQVADLPTGFVNGSIPATDVHSLRHTGPYRHIANGWATMNNLQQNKAFKTNKNIHPFENYVSIPGQVPENELVTDISFSVK